MENNNLSVYMQNILANLHGGITLEEADFLANLASSVEEGSILEVGSYQGKSSLALYDGAIKRSVRNTPDIYCIEPHEPFVGIYGGKFGPEDRGAFYKIMLSTKAYQGVALINLSSEKVCKQWEKPLGLVFIDGDHTYEGVLRDVRCWLPHIVANGLIVFDDALDPNIGPYRVIKELLNSKNFIFDSKKGKIIALRKVQDFSIATIPKQPAKQLKLLVVSMEIYKSGGMLRFERMGKELRDHGHYLAFCNASGKALPEKWDGEMPVIDISQANQEIWDAVMLPGCAGFNLNDNREYLETFTGDHFGIRIQHILNDTLLRDNFYQLNKIFQPHLVIFNNSHWDPGTYTEFSGNQFHTLIGGVYTKKWKSTHQKDVKKCIIGGQARKNPLPLVESLFFLPEEYSLVLFGDDVYELSVRYQELIKSGRLTLLGHIVENQLPDYYASVNLVVSTEKNAGWSNLVAEAMAAGVLVVCTSAGTLSLAIHDYTACVIQECNADIIASTISNLWKDQTKCNSLIINAKKHIQSFSWDYYTFSFLQLIQKKITSHYFYAPEFEMFGKWLVSDRIDGLDSLFRTVKGKTVLDLGIADGIISKICLDSGAKFIHGIDIEEDRVKKASTLCNHPASLFITADLNNGLSPIIENFVHTKYDVVLYLGVHHHLLPQNHKNILHEIANCCSFQIYIRTSNRLFLEEDLQNELALLGFKLIFTKQGCSSNLLGSLWTFQRATTIV
jgi:predicted O-methyltransferase YrrM/2-polyprenyl-3-methyl-5-hydroxy-6-metoxy-1,4-benzoquinol methylase